jgi:hypothetical protein
MVHQFHLRALIKGGHGHGIGTGITTFDVATELEPSPQLDIPEVITGIVSNLTPELFLKLCNEDSEVAFEGHRYRVSKIETDCTFELSILVPPS